MQTLNVKKIAVDNVWMLKEVSKFLVDCVNRGDTKSALAILKANIRDDDDLCGVLFQCEEDYESAIDNGNLAELKSLLALDKRHIDLQL